MESEVMAVWYGSSHLAVLADEFFHIPKEHVPGIAQPAPAGVTDFGEILANHHIVAEIYSVLSGRDLRYCK